MYILGLNAFHGDAAAALIKDGRLIAAVEEERFNRIKHCAGFPTEAIQYCLRAAGIDIGQVDHVGISRDPSAHLHKKVLAAARRATRGMVGRRQKAEGREFGPVALLEGETSALAGSQAGLIASFEANADRMSAVPAGNGASALGGGNGYAKGLAGQLADRLRNAAKVRDLRDELANALGVSRQELRAEFHNIEHHRAHLASSFFVSPFEHAALLSIDGFGDFISTMWAVGQDRRIDVLGQVEYPHSLGILYTATTQFLGFPHYGDEGKVMGLAPYGAPRFIEQLREIVRTEKNGQFRLDLDFFRHHAEGVEMSWSKGPPVIGKIFSDEYSNVFGRPREPQAPLTDRDRDLAASLQLRLEEVAFHVLNHLHDQTRLTDLGLSGGVAYNSVMNGKILLNTPFRNVFIQPAAGDSGTALGVCYQIWNEVAQIVNLRSSAPGKKESQINNLRYMEGAYTGPEFSDEETLEELENSNLRFEKLSDRELTRCAAADIADGLVVGWFQGRMEFGPRALGNRSILVDPRRADMKEILNQRIKKREPFRPFAPSILVERVGDYFEQTHPAPTMLMVYQIKADRRAAIPAVTHVDGSGRLQTVSREMNPRYYQLIEDFGKLTGVPVVLNTSFNENEPIVCTPRDAIECFRKTRMDVLYIGNYEIRRS
jgi:carbamoyltransferase